MPGLPGQLENERNGRLVGAGVRLRGRKGSRWRCVRGMPRRHLHDTRRYGKIGMSPLSSRYISKRQGATGMRSMPHRHVRPRGRVGSLLAVPKVYRPSTLFDHKWFPWRRQRDGLSVPARTVPRWETNVRPMPRRSGVFGARDHHHHTAHQSHVLAQYPLFHHVPSMPFRNPLRWWLVWFPMP